MIQEITKFKVEGEALLFDTLEEAQIFDREASEANAALNLLGGKDEYPGFANGEGMIQISVDSYNEALKIYQDILERKFGDRNPHPMFVEDSKKSSALSSVGYTLRCIHKQDDVYYRVGQPYYARDLSKLKSKQILKVVDY